jgi:hypothetical protein
MAFETADKIGLHELEHYTEKHLDPLDRLREIRVPNLLVPRLIPRL